MGTMSDHPQPVAALFSISHSCVYLGVGLSTLKGLIARGELKTIRINRRRLLAVSELDRFIAERASAGATSAA
jgi:excisionase family DNA binding protein